MPPEVVDTRTALNRLLSNMHKLDKPITDRFGLPYLSVEHAYQAAKTLNPEERKLIANLVGKSEQWYGFPAKEAGQRVKLDPKWDERKLKVMKHLLEQKFKQTRFLEALRSTGTSPIAEIDPRGRDLYWARTPTGQGRNELGQLLELIRAIDRSGGSFNLSAGTDAAAKIKGQAPAANPLRNLTPEELLKQLKEGK